jgi:hypothetical protein
MQEKDLLTALSPGAQLWFVPPLEASHWAKRIDWYLGFQIRRAGPHQPANFSPELHNLVETLEVDVPMMRLAKEAPLMIASETLLPNHQTVVVPLAATGVSDESTAFAQWTLACHRIWQGLGQPLVRVFLPDRLSAQAFAAKWPQKDALDDLQVVAP